MPALDLATATPAAIRERVGELWSLGEVQAALAARRLPPLYAANDAEIKRAFTAERLPIGQAMAWIVYRDRRLAYVAAIALEETRQAITSSSLATALDMKMSWREALHELWHRLALNVGVTAYDGETSDRVIPADRWPRLRFMVCKDVGYGRSARAVGYPWPCDADRPLDESCGTRLAYDDVWVSRSDVLREWPGLQAGADGPEPSPANPMSTAEETLAAIAKSRSLGGQRRAKDIKHQADQWKTIARPIAINRGNALPSEKYSDLADLFLVSGLSNSGRRQANLHLSDGSRNW